VHGRVVPVEQAEHPELVRRVPVAQERFDRDEIFEALGHLPAGDVEVAGVHEVVAPLRPLAVRGPVLRAATEHLSQSKKHIKKHFPKVFI
jgi:hypothetical protein